MLLEPKKIKSATVSILSPICCEVMGPDAMILVFWMLSFKPGFTLFSFTFIKRPFSSSSLRLLFLPTILIPACDSSSPAFYMMYSAYKLNKRGDSIQPWLSPFPILKVKVKSLSRVRLFAIPWTVAYHAPPSVEFSRQEYWSGLPLPSPGDLPNPGIEPRSPALQADTLPSEPPGKLKL